MSITLNWNNKNANVTNFKVYRGTSNTNLTLLTTLASSATNYTDNTASINTLYYYRVNVVIGGLDEVPGSINSYATILDTGPGPTTLIAGSMEWGYFGNVLAADFINDATYKGLSATGTAFSSTLSQWRKYAYKGKILFVGNVVCRTSSVSPASFAKQLYNEGVYLGTGDSSLPHTSVGVGASAVPQIKRVFVDSYEFIVRGIKGNETTLPSDTGIYNTTTPPTTRESVFSEAGLIASGFSSWLPHPAYLAAGTIPTKLSAMNAATTILSNLLITQHFNSAAALVIPLTPTASQPITASPKDTSILCGYLPVLELVTP